MTLHRGAIAGKAVDDLSVGWPVPLHAVLQHVLGNVDERRARATGSGDMERLTNGERKILGAHHQLVVLGDAAGDAHGVTLLECVGANGRGRHLTGDAHHWDRVHIRVTQRRDHVRGGWATGDHGDAGTAGHVCVALGHVAGALLVTHENVANAAVKQRIVGGQDAPTWKSEHDLGAFHFQCFDEGLGPGHLHVLLLLDYSDFLCAQHAKTGPKNKTTSQLGGRAAQTACSRCR